MNITATLIIQVIAFAAFIIIINKVLWTPLSTLMEQRQKRIEDGLTAAERSQAERKETQLEAKQVIEQSKTHAADILSNAQKQALTIIDEAKTAAIVEADKIKLSANNDIAQEIGRAKTDLQSQVASLVMLGVSKVLQKEVDEKTHEKTLAELVKSL